MFMSNSKSVIQRIITNIICRGFSLENNNKRVFLNAFFNIKNDNNNEEE